MTVYYDLPVPQVPNDCEKCGRDSGHHLNCPNTPGLFEPVLAPEQPVEQVVTCANEGCQDAPKPWGGRGPKPKYCAAHGTSAKEATE